MKEPNSEAPSQSQPGNGAAGRVGVILIAAVTGIPLAFAPGLFLGYSTTPKLIAAYLAAALLLASAQQWWPDAMALWRTACGRIFFLLLFAQAALLAISTAFSHDLALSLGGTTWRRFGALTQIVILFIVAAMAAYAHTHRGLTRLLMMSIEAAGAIAAVYGILQYLGYDPLLPARLYTTPFTADVVRPPATLGHAVYFANFLVPVILIAAWFLITELHTARRLVHAAILVISLAALALSGTRSALLGIAAGAGLIGYMQRRHFRNKKVLAYCALSFVGAVILTAVFATSPVGRSFSTRLKQWVQDSKGGPRLMVWRDSWTLVREHWWTGIGPETFAGEFRKVQSVQLARAYPDYYHEAPHNLFIEVAVSQGLPVCVLLLSLVAVALICGFQSGARGSAEAGALVASLVAMTISIEFSPVIIANWFYVCAAIALLVASADFQGPVGIRAFRPLTRVFLASGAMLLMATAILYGAQDMLVAATGRRLARGDLDGARESYRISRKFPFPSDNLWCSRQMAVLARNLPQPRRDAALALARDASAAAEGSEEQRFMALYQSAVLALITNDFVLAEAKLRAAVSAAPLWYRPHMMLARILWLTGRVQESQRESDLAVDYAGSQGPDIKSTLERAKTQPRSATAANW